MTKKSFTGTAVLMGIIILAAKGMGLLRDIMIAGSYGTTTAAIAPHKTRITLGPS